MRDLWLTVTKKTVFVALYQLRDLYFNLEIN